MRTITPRHFDPMNTISARELRELALNMLDDEYGISTSSYELLRKVHDEHNIVSNDDIFVATRAQDGRWYLPEGHGLTVD